MNHTRLNFARENSTFFRNYFTRLTSSYRKLIWWRLFDCLRYGIQPAMRETHVFQLRRTRRKDRSVWILPTFAAMPQVQTTHAGAMLCEINKAKYLRGETRSICIKSTVWSFLPLCMNKQTLFSVLQTSVYAMQNCDARKLRYQKLKSRTALQETHEER